MTMNTRFALHFYFKKPKQPKQNNQNALPIYLRISAAAGRSEIATQRTWDPTRWNAISGRATGTREDARALNTYLDTLQAQVYEAHRQLIADNEEVTASAIKQRATGKKEKGRMLIPIFTQHNEQVESLIGKEFAPRTHERYETALGHTISFLQWKYKVDDIEIEALDYEFVSQFEYWLKAIRGCCHNTAVKYISNVRKIINSCLLNGWLARDPFVGYKSNKREVIREVLTPSEIETLTNKVFATQRLGIVRDLFIFSCFTGLAYADVKKLKPTEIGKGVDKNDWIFTQRTKTTVPVHIPILPEAQRILDKYAMHPLCVNRGTVLPVPSNQKMNAYLQEIADLCGITKKMTYHTARHTFATTVALSNGVPIETVSKILGHTNIKTTQLYAKILDTKLSEDMERLKEKLIARSVSQAQNLPYVQLTQPQKS